jgi:hypothetical protein
VVPRAQRGAAEGEEGFPREKSRVKVRQALLIAGEGVGIVSNCTPDRRECGPLACAWWRRSGDRAPAGTRMHRDAQRRKDKAAHVREHSTLSTERWGTLGHSLFSPCQRDASAWWCCAAAEKRLQQRLRARAGAKRGRAPSTRQGGAPTEVAACAVAGCGDATCMQRSRGRHAL